MLRFDPDERISASEALLHPFLKEYHEYIEEDYPDIEKKFDQDFEDPNVEENALRQLVYEEVQHYHQEIYNNPKMLDIYDKAYND